MNNKSIQFLRGTDANIKKSSETLLDGQPLYNKDKNTLSIGGGAGGNAVNKKPINSSGLIGDDYNIQFNETSKKFEYTEDGVQFTQSNITDGTGTYGIQ